MEEEEASVTLPTKALASLHRKSTTQPHNNNNKNTGTGRNFVPVSPATGYLKFVVSRACHRKRVFNSWNCCKGSQAHTINSGALVLSITTKAALDALSFGSDWVCDAKCKQMTSITERTIVSCAWRGTSVILGKHLDLGNFRVRIQTSGAVTEWFKEFVNYEVNSSSIIRSLYHDAGTST